MPFRPELGLRKPLPLIRGRASTGLDPNPGGAITQPTDLDQAVFALFSDEAEKVALDTERHVLAQIRVGHQAAAIARLRHGGQQIRA